jgi:hypothetical protein
MKDYRDWFSLNQELGFPFKVVVVENRESATLGIIKYQRKIENLKFINKCWVN